MTFSLDGTYEALPSPLNSYFPLTLQNGPNTSDGPFTRFVSAGTYGNNQSGKLLIDSFNMTATPQVLNSFYITCTSAFAATYVGDVVNLGGGGDEAVAFGTLPYYTTTDPGSATWSLYNVDTGVATRTVSVPSLQYTAPAGLGTALVTFKLLTPSYFTQLTTYSGSPGMLGIQRLDVASATLLAPVFISLPAGFGSLWYAAATDAYCALVDSNGYVYLVDIAGGTVQTLNTWQTAFTTNGGQYEIFTFVGSYLYLLMYDSGTATDGFYSVSMAGAVTRLGNGPWTSDGWGGSASNRPVVYAVTYPYEGNLYVLKSYNSSSDTDGGPGVVMLQGIPTAHLSLTDALHVSSTAPQLTVINVLANALTVGSASNASWIQRLIDALSITTAMSALWDVMQTLTDSAAFDDGLEAALRAVVTDSVHWTDVPSAWMGLALVLADQLRIVSSSAAAYDAHVVIALSFALRELIADAQRGYLADGVSLTEALVQRVAAFAGLLDSWQLAATQSSSAILHAILSDSAGFSDGLTDYLAIRQALLDGAQFGITLYTGQDMYVAWVMTTPTRAMRRYVNYPFNSFGELNGRLCGANANGLYWLDGDTDDGAEIPAMIRSGLMDFGSRQLKRMDRAYLGYTSDGTLGLKVITTSETGDEVAYSYKMIQKPANAPRESRVQIGRGMRSVYWQFELINEAGSDFELHDLTLLPLILSRRVS